MLSQFSSVFDYSELVKTLTVLFQLLTEEIATSAVLFQLSAEKIATSAVLFKLSAEEIATSAVLLTEEFNIMISNCEVLMSSSCISSYSLLRNIETFRLFRTLICKINFDCLNTLINLIIQCVNLLLLLLSLILMSVIIIKLSHICINSILS